MLHLRRIHATRFVTIALVLVSTAATSAAWATPISDKYAQLGGAAGFLGQPTIPETWAPDGEGRYRHYEGGSIYWHPRTGAHEVHGLIRQRWAQLKWELGYLGYPVTDEINTVDGGGRVSRFEGGELIWREKTNTVREVKASDLVVELPFPAGETWYVIQSHAGAGGSHVGQFSYCWDFRRTGAQSQSNGKHFTAVANGRIVHADDSYGSGKSNPGNVVVQRLGPSRYASYLHNKAGSYTAHFGAGSLFLPQMLPWSNRPSPSTGAVLATMGDTGTGVGAYHLHFCVTTAPDRPGHKPFESVPVSFRNYEVSTLGLTWTDVSQGVPRAGQLLRRKGTQGSAAINASAAPNGFGVVTAAVKLVGAGQPVSSGVLALTVTSAWGEPLKTVTRPIGSITAGPWLATITGVPAYTGLKVVVTYSGAWSIPTSGGSIGGESSPFSLPADTSTIVPVDLKVGQVPK
jgi:LGFP repeat-containing protein